MNEEKNALVANSPKHFQGPSLPAVNQPVAITQPAGSTAASRAGQALC